jgi:hypothetical protein
LCVNILPALAETELWKNKTDTITNVNTGEAKDHRDLVSCLTEDSLLWTFCFFSNVLEAMLGM